MDILDNVIPYIPKEEEKVQQETAKILGAPRRATGSRRSSSPVSATCTRVNVRDGHTECVSAGPRPRGRRSTRCADALRAFGREFTDLGLPSAPPELCRVHEDPYRPAAPPRPRPNDGMTTVVGRLREDSGPAERGQVRAALAQHQAGCGQGRHPGGRVPGAPRPGLSAAAGRARNSQACRLPWRERPAKLCAVQRGGSLGVRAVLVAPRAFHLGESRRCEHRSPASRPR